MTPTGPAPAPRRRPVEGPGGRCKVLHVLSGKERGGILRVLSAIVSAAAASPVEVVVLVLGKTEAALPSGARVERVGERGPWSLRSAAAAIRLVRRERFHVVHTHSLVSNLYGWLLARAGRRPRHVLQVHAHLHAMLRDTQRSRMRGALILRGNLRALRTCDRVIAVSASVKDYLAELGVDPGKIHILRNTVDPVRLEAASREPSAAAAAIRDRVRGAAGNLPPVVGALGRLSTEKNFALLLQAAAKILQSTPAFFVIVGDGPERPRLERLAVDLGIQDRVLFPGWVANPYPLLSDWDLLALTSSSEGFGLVVLEAMALGKPVVATRVGAVPEIVRHEECGELVPPGDAGALADALLRLLRDPRRRESMGRRGRSIAVAEFAPAGMFRRLEGLYAELAAGDASMPRPGAGGPEAGQCASSS